MFSQKTFKALFRVCSKKELLYILDKIPDSTKLKLRKEKTFYEKERDDLLCKERSVVSSKRTEGLEGLIVRVLLAVIYLQR